MDCASGCDMNFIRSEINIVDFLLDREAADVHILITRHGTGSGGINYQLIFFGQHYFKSQLDTLYFNTDPNATDFEERDMQIKYLKLGLAPYIAKTDAARDVVISFKRIESAAKKKDTAVISKKDPWNYWVFKAGVSGYISADEVYKEYRLGGNFSANRVTEESKTGFEFNPGKNKTTYELEDSSGNKEKIGIKNNYYDFSQYFVKSINEHWSLGYQVGLSRSTFSNNKNRIELSTGIEYNIFPYKDVNTKFFTFSYIIQIRHNVYFDTTLYEKTKETLYRHGIQSKISLNQKWGRIGFGAQYHNYLHNWKYYNLGINGSVDIRIAGGLSFTIYTSAELTHDQLFLSKGGATTEEVLTRRRQLASGYKFYTNFGINYRFGSRLNNFVNPRFD